MHFVSPVCVVRIVSTVSTVRNQNSKKKQKPKLLFQFSSNIVILLDSEEIKQSGD